LPETHTARHSSARGALRLPWYHEGL